MLQVATASTVHRKHGQSTRPPTFFMAAPAQVYDKAECEAMGMGLFLGVAEASAEPPHFIHLKYSPPGG